MITLVKIGSDVDAINYNLETPLHTAVLYGKFENLTLFVCRFFLKICLPVFFTGRSEIAALLMSRQAKIDVKNQDWNTPLHHAAKYGKNFDNSMKKKTVQNS